MNRWKSAYPTDYTAQVQRAIGPLPHDFFIRGKADWLKRFFAKQRFVRPRILDIGCGVGLLHQYLENVVGCDVSNDALVEAKMRNPAADYRCHDGATLPAADGEFNVALAVTVMHHVPPADWPAFVAEAARVVRPGGAFVVIEHNPLNPLTRLSVARSELDFDAVLLRAGATLELMRAAGLTAGCEYLFFTPLRATQPIDRALRWLPMGAQYAAYGVKSG